MQNLLHASNYRTDDTCLGRFPIIQVMTVMLVIVKKQEHHLLVKPCLPLSILLSLSNYSYSCLNSIIFHFIHFIYILVIWDSSSVHPNLSERGRVHPKMRKPLSLRLLAQQNGVRIHLASVTAAQSWCFSFFALHPPVTWQGTRTEPPHPPSCTTSPNPLVSSQLLLHSCFLKKCVCVCVKSFCVKVNNV